MTYFYTTPTNLGLAAHANAQANGTVVSWTHIAVGDGNGVPVTPGQAAIALAHEVHRVAISSKTQHPDNPNWIIVEGVILSTVGGWTIRELGLIGDGGKLLFVGNFPETYKPVLETENASRDMTIKMIVEVASAATVSLVVDPSVAVATNQGIANSMAAHLAAADPHPQYLTAAEGQAQVDAHANAADPHPQYMTAAETTAAITAGQTSLAELFFLAAGI